MERGRHGRGLRLTFPYRGLQTRTARRTAQGGADCRGGEDGAGRRGLQRWGSRAAADWNGMARRTAQGGAAEARRAQRGAADVQTSREARWTSREAQRRLDWERRRLSIGKVAAVAVARARQSFPPRANFPARAPTFPLPRPPVTVRRFPLAYARVSRDYSAERDYALD